MSDADTSLLYETDDELHEAGKAERAELLGGTKSWTKTLFGVMVAPTLMELREG